MLARWSGAALLGAMVMVTAACETMAPQLGAMPVERVELASIDSPAGIGKARTAAPAQIVVTAWGHPAFNAWPKFRLIVDGRAVGEAEVSSKAVTTYAFPVEMDLGRTQRIIVEYINDVSVGGEDRNLFVQSISVNGRMILATDDRVAYDRFRLDGRDVSRGQSEMFWNGALIFRVTPKDLVPLGPTS